MDDEPRRPVCDLYDEACQALTDSGWTVTRLSRTHFVATRGDGLAISTQRIAMKDAVWVGDGKISCHTDMAGIGRAVAAHDAFAGRLLALSLRGSVYVWGIGEEGLHVRTFLAGRPGDQPEDLGEDRSYLLCHDGTTRSLPDRVGLPGGDADVLVDGEPMDLLMANEVIVI